MENNLTLARVHVACAAEMRVNTFIFRRAVIQITLWRLTATHNLQCAWRWAYIRLSTYDNEFAVILWHCILVPETLSSFILVLHLNIFCSYWPDDEHPMHSIVTSLFLCGGINTTVGQFVLPVPLFLWLIDSYLCSAIALSAPLTEHNKLPLTLVPDIDNSTQDSTMPSPRVVIATE